VGGGGVLLDVAECGFYVFHGAVDVPRDDLLGLPLRGLVHRNITQISELGLIILCFEELRWLHALSPFERFDELGFGFADVLGVCAEELLQHDGCGDVGIVIEGHSPHFIVVGFFDDGGELLEELC
jgi:hypothetical protein